MRAIYLILLLLGSSTQLLAKSAILSPEGIFSLSGPDSLGTKQYSRVLTGYEKQFYELTGYASGDAPPVVVVLHDSSDSLQGSAFLRVDSVEESIPKIQVDIPYKALSDETTATVLAQAMILRQYYQGKSPAAGSRITDFPAWLLHGLGKLCDPNAVFSVIPAFYLRGAVPPSTADLLVQKPPAFNSELLGVYDTMAAQLLSAGLKGSGGDRSLRDWIGEFDFNAATRAPSSWPPNWEMQSVERRWLLLMAGDSGESEGVVTILGVDQTLARYDEILSKMTTPDHSIAGLKKEKGSLYLVGQLATRLTALRLQASPLCDPLLDKMIELCQKFKRLSEKKITEKEKTLATLRADMLKQSSSIDAYLDWFEAVKLPVKSGLFDTLLKTPEVPVQQGPIGHYLDTIESRGW